MNIANIFGLHIGCRARCEDSCCENVGEIIQLKQKWVRIQYTEYNEGRWFEIKNCKLILKPLSAISDEDKAELEKQLDEYNCEIQLVAAIVNIISKSKEIVHLGVPNKTALWLASKGYDIGIVPDEYKEVEE